ncbi:MAG: WbuC family cupin fold metalloprotein [Verrucomicrobiaceae bacterium]|nr:WbuC family cupin fold metalloprotein [Verrucomicrobiaceae bacterium]
MQRALPAVSGSVFVLTDEILQMGFAAAAASPRKRIILPVHRSDESVVQRMLNFMQPGTYIQPHRHPQQHAIETIQVLRGAMDFLVFSPDGDVIQRHRLQSDSLGLIDIEPGVWHGMVVLEPNTVILEIKRGPYDANADKFFAPWAPPEGRPEAEAYLTQLTSV